MLKIFHHLHEAGAFASYNHAIHAYWSIRELRSRQRSPFSTRQDSNNTRRSLQLLTHNQTNQSIPLIRRGLSQFSRENSW